MATKKSKKTAPKKAAPKKAAKPSAAKPKAKKAAVKKAVPVKISRAFIAAVNQPKPCICIKKAGRWFCMKEEDGALIQCDGPFATKAICEAHVCRD